MKKTPKIVVLMTALLFCYGFLMGGQQLILLSVAQQFGIGVLGMGTFVSVIHVAALIAPAAMGPIADRVGKQKILVLFAVIFGCGCLLAAVSPVLTVFLMALLLIGSGYSVCESLVSAVCVEVDPDKGAQYINLTQCLLSVGAVLGPIVMSWFDAWQLLYILCGIPLIVLGIWLSRTPFPKAIASIQEKAPLLPKALLSPIFLAFIVSMLMYVGLETGFGYFVELLFETKTVGTILSAYGISAYWGGMAISRLIYSFRSYRPRQAVRLSFLAAAASFVLLILFRNGWVCLALCFLVGFTYGPIWTTLVAGAAERFPRYKASATGLLSAACGLGGIFYPVVMATIVELVDIRIGFVLLAVSATVGAILAFVLKNTKEGE